MANYTTLKSTIEDNIKQNGIGAITGPVLQSALLAMVNSLGAGYQFAGIAIPSTSPGTPDQKVFYLAGAGTYPDFGGLVIPTGKLGVLYFDSEWHISSVDLPPIVEITANENQSGKSLISVDGSEYEISDGSAQDIIDRMILAINGKSVDINSFTNGYVEHSSGAIVSNNSWKHSDFIRISPNSNIVYSYLETGNDRVSAIAFYDSEYNFISDVCNIGSRSDKRIFYNIPANTEFVRFTILATDVSVANIIVFPAEYGISIQENAEKINTIQNYYLDSQGCALYNTAFSTVLYNVSNLRGKRLQTFSPTSSAYVASFALFDSFSIIGNVALAYGQTTNNGAIGNVDLSLYPKAVCCAITYLSANDDTTDVISFIDNADVRLDVRNGYRDRFGECYRINALAASLTFNGLQNGIAGNKQLSFTANIDDEFTGIRFGQGYNLYGGMFAYITPSKLYVYKNNDLSNSVAEETHGLTFSSFIAVNIRFDRNTRTHIRIIGDSGAYDMTTELYLLGSHGPIFLTAISGLKNIVISSTSLNLDSKVWFVGDSFISINDNGRWGYHLVNQYKANPMIIGYPGAGAENVLPFIRSALAFGNPRFIVWCIGMNNPDNGAINPTWKTYTDEFILICKERGIVPIFQLIPNSKGSSPESSDLSNQHLNDYKNAYMESLGYRTIDIPKIVGADSVGNWRTGWHYSDYIHTNELSASAIALAMITNVPECLNEQ